MSDVMPDGETITAALVVIGEEILSGRTKDENTAFIAGYLTRVGISLREVRVVADVQTEIVDALNALRRRYTYVFTTGGIGPTHDDVTTDAIGKAFGVSVDIRDDAVAAMRLQYRREDLNPARLRMARIPDGATLIHNAVSRAPGYMLENVIVMAGIPRIMQVMLDEVMPRLAKGRPVLSRSVRVNVPESDMAPSLAALQKTYPDLQMGSYPFFEHRRYGTYIVLRSAREDRLDEALAALWNLIDEHGFAASSEEKT